VNDQLTYKLSLSIDTRNPKLAIEGEPYDFFLRVKNIGDIDFPGAKIPVRIFWPTVGSGSTVNNPIEVDSLSPGEVSEYNSEVTPLVAGFTFFSINFPAKSARYGITTHINYHDHLKIEQGKVLLFLEDERRRLLPGMVFGKVQARSHGELLAQQEVYYAQKALRWAIIAFAAAVTFGLIDVLLTILFNMKII